MATSQKAKIAVELGRTLVDFAAMNDAGDHQIFTAGDNLWSGKSGYEPNVRPNGIVSGQRLLSPHASNDTVTIAAFTAYSKGVLRSVAATSLALTRPSTNDFKICSVTMNDEGTIAQVEGSESTEFSEVRGAAGGPPLIPVDSVELGQVRFSDQTPAVIAADEIYQDVGNHAEYADYPVPETFNVGSGINAVNAAEQFAHVKFNEAMPLSHEGGVPKRIYIKYYVPSLTVMPRVSDFKPAALGISKSSVSIYEGSGVSGAIGSMKADSVGDVSFTIYTNDNITDGILREEGEITTVKFWPDANKSPYIVSQGMLGVDTDFPTNAPNTLSATVYCEKPSVRYSS